jgi:hypothetical protein
LLEVFGADNPRTFRIENKNQLSDLLADKTFADADEIQVEYLITRKTELRWLS